MTTLRVAIRTLARQPAFATTAVLTLALGIGLSAAVYTVADAILIRRLPVRDQERVLVLWGRKPTESFDYPLDLASGRDFARQSRTMERVAATVYEGATPVLIRDGDRASRLRRALVSGDFFTVLDAKPILGRTLRESDDAWGAERAIVLSNTTWRHRFGGDTNVIGRRLLMHEDGATYTIVGVMPPGLDYPHGVDFWATIRAALPNSSLQYTAVNLIGRLAPGRTADNVRDELTAFFSRSGALWLKELRAAANPLSTHIVGDTTPALLAFVAASVLLLLIACLNVANLLLVRGLARAREMAVRSALGADRSHLVRQLLVENALLALGAGALGVVVAWGAVRAFVSFAPETVPRLDEIRVSAATVGATLAISLTTLFIFALAPALSTSRPNLNDALRSDTRQTAGKRSRFTTELLVAGQVAFAVVVLSAAGLIARSLMNLEGADFSFDKSRLLIAELALRFDQLEDVAKQSAAVDHTVSLVQQLPEVRSVSPVVAAPFGGGWDGRPLKEGQTLTDVSTVPMLNMELVGPSYFETLGVAIVRGRAFAESDREGTASVVVLSQNAARYYWPGEDPLGKRLYMGEQRDRSFTVVGVARETRYRELREARASIYFPLRQPFFPFTATTLAIRTRGEPANAVASLRRAIGESVPGVALASVAPFDTYLQRPLALPRLNTLLLGIFAAACLVLSAIGLFGVMSTMVKQRTREFGVRMALGATPGAVRRIVLGRGIAIASGGVMGGILAAVAANRFLASLLYGVTPTDVATLAAISALLLVLAMVATLIPARMGTRINVVAALRAEG